MTTATKGNRVAPTKTKRSPWPATLLGNAWQAVNDTAWSDLRAVNGTAKVTEYTDAKGRHYADTLYTRITNGEAVTLIMAWMDAVGPRISSTWSLWYQLAAVAYGWSPERDKLDTSARQRDAWYPGELTVELFFQLDALAVQLDGARSETSVELHLDGRFEDPSFQGQVRAALQDDGAEATWLLPLPACKDPKTGKPTGRPHRDKDGKWKCDPVTIEDPISRAKKSVNGFLAVVAMVAIIVWMNEKKERRSRRKE